MLHGGIAVRSALALRGMQVDKMCPKCGEVEENPLHMIIRCPEAALIWRLSPLRLEFDPGISSSFEGWTDWLLVKIKDEQWWSLFWAIAWSIWCARNLWVFEGKKVELQQVTNRAIGIVTEYEAANTRLRGESCSDVGRRRWTPPEDSWFKVNVDAAVFANDWLGLGAILRDKDGDTLMATCRRVRGGNSADVAEALAARQGLTTAMEAGFYSIVLETDCLKVSTHLQRQYRESSVFGLIIGDILCMASSCTKFKVSHVRREGNRVAHELAKGSLSFEDWRVWLEETPSHIQAYVTDDLSSSE